MTAGMTNSWWYRMFEPSVYGVVPQLYKDAGLTDDLNAAPTTLEKNIKMLAGLPLIAHPGEMFDYSNNSVDTLCRLVEVVSGQSFDEYLQQHIFTPGTRRISVAPAVCTGRRPTTSGSRRCCSTRASWTGSGCSARPRWS
jgi:CubicO group peptidase (beta-lactamase class C family)